MGEVWNESQEKSPFYKFWEKNICWKYKDDKIVSCNLIDGF